MHSLTTRAAAERYRQQRLLAPIAKPQLRPRRQLSERQKLWLARVLGVVALSILGTALYPEGKPTHPLRVADEMPVGHTTWSESDYFN
jgi:hypothetical protein